MASTALGGEFVTSTRSQVAKGDMNVQTPDGYNVPVYLFYGQPDFISAEEQAEVFAWFSNHKVTWEFPEKNFNMSMTGNTRQTLDGGYARDITNTNHPYPTYASSCTNGGDEGTKCSLYDNRYSNPMGDYKVVENIQFTNGWIQNVARDTDCSLTMSWEMNNNPQTISGLGLKMDQLRYQELDNSHTWSTHTLDYNGGMGYGPGPDINPNVDMRQSGILVLEANFNNLAYWNSTVDSWEDKYIMVYLEGHDRDGREWSGWYLGFDFCGTKSDNSGAWAGDGICNDWIIKIGNAGNNIYKNSRIMCEDLGGGPAISTVAGTQVSDIDYNDIVFDVDVQANTNGDKLNSIIDITVQAAGGTMPLAVFYKDDNEDKMLFEVHEFLCRTNGVDATGEIYKKMINTKGDKSPATITDSNTQTRESRKFTIYVNDYRQCDNNIQLKNNSKEELVIPNSAKGFSLDRLSIKVYRHNTKDYVSNPQSASEADWLTLENIDGEAPLKFCVPQKDSNGNWVKWMQERVQIGNGYSDFYRWVANPTESFWNGTKTTTNLY